jgi:hypothetical protein
MVNEVKFFKDWKLILFFSMISIIITVIASLFQHGLFKFLNVISWCILSYYFYKDIFLLINKLDLSNDFTLWILKIASGIVAVIGLLFGGIMFMGSIVTNAEPVSMDLGIILLSAGFLGMFMIFRTKRRSKHLYVNK